MILCLEAMEPDNEPVDDGEEIDGRIRDEMPADQQINVPETRGWERLGRYLLSKGPELLFFVLTSLIGLAAYLMWRYVRMEFDGIIKDMFEDEAQPIDSL